MSHTPTPWALTTVPTSCGICHRIGPFPSKFGSRETHACIYVDYEKNGKELLANAELIVKAVNAHEAMKEALEELLGITDSHNPEDGFDLDGDICRYCGRDYSGDGESLTLCQSDDCPGYIARQALTLANGGTP